MSHASEIARWLVIQTANRLINVDWNGAAWKNTGKGGTTFGGAEFCTPAPITAQAVEDIANMSHTAHPERPALFVELCAGLASVSLRLQDHLGGSPQHVRLRVRLNGQEDRPPRPTRPVVLPARIP